MSPDEIRDALKQVKYPGFSRDIISFGLVKEVRSDPAEIYVRIEIQTRNEKIPQAISQEAHSALDPLSGRTPVKIDIEIKDAPAAASSSAGKSSIPGVKKIIAVASGKGGVGKSTVSSNLAVAMARSGARTGLCDCDLYGPSMSLMFGTHERPLANDQEEIIPVEVHGVQLMSMGLLLDERSPVIVRGPMATRYTQQFLRQVAWDRLDYLVLDLPPGTGDIQLTISQTVAVDGTLIVTTPQEVAVADARKAVSMFEKVQVPIIGLVENMAWFECDAGKRYPIFGEGGGKREADALSVPLLEQIPIDLQTRERGDSGSPIALLDPEESKVAASFQRLASHVRQVYPVPAIAL